MFEHGYRASLGSLIPVASLLDCFCWREKSFDGDVGDVATVLLACVRRWYVGR